MQGEETDASDKEWWGDEGESWKTGSQAKRDRMDLYVEWMVTPKAERDPRTKTELAERLEVTPQTLRNYDRDPKVQQAVLEKGRGLAKVSKALEVVDRLYERAMGRGGIDVTPAAANTAAKLFLEWIEKQTGEAASDLQSFTDEEIVEKLVEMQEALNARHSA